MLQLLRSLIPDAPDDFFFNPKAQRRDRKLSFDRLVAFLISATTSDKNCGIANKLNQFLTLANLSNLWPDAHSCSASSVTRARQKIRWQAFESIFSEAVALSHQLCPNRTEHSWKGMRVIGIDGSKYTLPASPQIRQEFDPCSGLDKDGKGHYPQANALVAYDALRRVPLYCSLNSVHSSEREVAKEFLRHLPTGAVQLYDRGYPSFDFLHTLLSGYSGYFLMRCSRFAFAAVIDFVKSGKKQDIITILPSKNLKKRFPTQSLTLRAIRFENALGEVSVLLTNMYDTHKFTDQELIELYGRRWTVENHYRNDKVFIEIEKFHSRSANGIRQEFYAAAIASTIAAILTWCAAANKKQNAAKPQFKNALKCFAQLSALLACYNDQLCLKVFTRLLDSIANLRYYHHQKPRKPQPRVSKGPHNKWKNKQLLIKELKSKP